MSYEEIYLYNYLNDYLLNTFKDFLVLIRRTDDFSKVYIYYILILYNISLKHLQSFCYFNKS